MRDQILVVGCLLMAAGQSRRFGRENKLTVPFKGKPLVCHAMDTVKLMRNRLERQNSLRIDPMVVTCWPEVALLCEAGEMPCVMCDGGMKSDTVRAGIAAASGRGWDGCLFLSGDQPLITEESLVDLIERFKADPEAVCRLVWQGSPVGPTIFPAALFAELMKMQGDEGGRQLIRSKKIQVTDLEAKNFKETVDLDTMKDYDRLINDI